VAGSVARPARPAWPHVAELALPASRAIGLPPALPLCLLLCLLAVHTAVFRDGPQRQGVVSRRGVPAGGPARGRLDGAGREGPPLADARVDRGHSAALPAGSPRLLRLPLPARHPDRPLRLAGGAPLPKTPFAGIQPGDAVVDPHPLLPARRRARGVPGRPAPFGVRVGHSRADARPAVHRRPLATGLDEGGQPPAARGLDVLRLRPSLCRRIPGKPARQTILVPLSMPQRSTPVLAQPVARRPAHGRGHLHRLRQMR